MFSRLAEDTAVEIERARWIREFEIAVRDHAPKKMEQNDLIEIVNLSTRHGLLMVAECNACTREKRRGESEDDYNKDRRAVQIPRIKKDLLHVERRLRVLAKRLGCKMRFGSDPRGCTVKLITPDGYTNDMGQEGVAVPQ